MSLRIALRRGHGFAPLQSGHVYLVKVIEELDDGTLLYECTPHRCPTPEDYADEARAQIAEDIAKTEEARA